MSKKNCAIVLAATGNMAFALANTLIGLKKYSPNLADDIIVYEQGFNDKDKRIINGIIPVKFIDYKFFLQSDINQKQINTFTSLTYARYECFDLLNQYKNVIWLDIDILIQKDISGIIEYAQETGISACKEKELVRINFTKPIEGYKMDIPNYNAGILILSDKLLHYEKLKEWCYKTTEKYKDFLCFADQGIIALMNQEFNFNINPLPDLYNYYILFEDASNAFIIHLYGPQKFWNFFDNEEWFKNHQEWLDLGGSPGKVYKLTITQQLIYQKTPRIMHRIRNDLDFINYMVRRYGQKDIDIAFKEFADLIIAGKVKTYDPLFELRIKRKRLMERR